MEDVTRSKSTDHSKDRQLSTVEKSREGEATTKEKHNRFRCSSVELLKSLKVEFVVMVENRYLSLT